MDIAKIIDHTNINPGATPEEIKKTRKNRPCLVSNKLRKFVAQVANRERDMRMAMKCRPVDNLGDVKTAQIYDGLLRHIEYQSQADEVYTNGGEYALAGGWGYWRVLSEYVPDGFEQEIFIRKIENPLSVYLDPRGNYCFIREGLTKEEFEEQYPAAERVDFESVSRGEDWALWYEPDKIFIAEYFYKELYDKTIAKVRPLANPQLESKVIEIKDDITKEFLQSQGFQILETRTFKAHRIKWCKITGHEILEERTLPGTMIPVVL